MSAAKRKRILRKLWKDNIDIAKKGYWIKSMAEAAEEDPDGFFADAGKAITSMLDKGVTKQELGSLARWMSYETIFSAICELEDEGVLTLSLHEGLLSADPSGREGRPEVKKRLKAKKTSKKS